MCRIKFVDLNNRLVEKIAKLGIESICADYFQEVLKTRYPILVTASNPHFSFGGGIDAKFYEYFPYLCRAKQLKGGKNERLGNICFCISVDKTFKATKELVQEAIEFAVGTALDGETVLISGLGTGIGSGNFTEDDFVEIMRIIRN